MPEIDFEIPEVESPSLEFSGDAGSSFEQNDSFLSKWNQNVKFEEISETPQETFDTPENLDNKDFLSKFNDSYQFEEISSQQEIPKPSFLDKLNESFSNKSNIEEFSSEEPGWNSEKENPFSRNNGPLDSEKSFKNQIDTENTSPEKLTETQTEKMGLTDEEKAKIKEETGWSDEIIDAISSMEEYEIYKNAGLVEVEINGKKCLVRSDIDWDQKDAFGQTNRERAEQGKPPVDKNGKPIELHHIGQKADGPLAELTQEEHRGKENDSVLHDKTKESEIDRNHFGNTERPNHWKDRIAQEEPKNE